MTDISDVDFYTLTRYGASAVTSATETVVKLSDGETLGGLLQVWGDIGSEDTISSICIRVAVPRAIAAKVVALQSKGKPLDSMTMVM